MTPTEATTTPFAIRSSTYMGLVTREWIRRWWWLPAIAIFISAMLGFTISIRFLFLAAILLCLVVPLAMLPIYYHSLTPSMRLAILAKRVRISDDCMKLLFEPIDENISAPDTIVIMWEEFSCLKFSRTAFILRMKGKYRYLPIPYTSLATVDDLRKFSSLLQRHVATS